MNKPKNSSKHKKKTKIKKLQKKSIESLDPSPINKSVRYSLWTFLGILVLIGLGYAGTTLSNSNSGYLVSDNITVNNTGIFYGGDKSFTKTADVVVCRGTDALDDLKKSFECDYVCLSTDSDCTDEISQCMGNICYVKDGFYNLISDISIRSNTKIIGDSNVTFNLSIQFNFNSIPKDNLSNVGFYNLKINSTITSVDKGVDSYKSIFNLTQLNSLDNLVFDNIEASNINGSVIGIDVSTAGTYGNNIYMNNLRFLDVRDGVTLDTKTSELPNKYRNVHISNYYFYNNYSYDLFYASTNIYKGNAINFRSIDTGTINNLYIRKSSDGPAIVGQSSNNIDISNIYTLDQYDHAIKLVNNNKNINIKNVFVKSPRMYGALYLLNQDYNTPQITENIYASNIYCLNCSADVTGVNRPVIEVAQIDSTQNGIDSLRNIKIENFYIDGSPSYGAITIYPNKGNIENLKISNGYINNTDNAGIRIAGTGDLINSKIEDVTIRNAGINPTDTAKSTGIDITNVNITNLILRNINVYNDTITGKMYSRFTFYANNYGNMSIIGDNNRGYNLGADQLYVNTRTGSIIYSFSGENYSGAITDSSYTTCDNNEKTRAHDGRTIYNSTTSCTCINGNWNCYRLNDSTYNQKADYQFTNNNFNGSGNYTSLGNLNINNINRTGVIFPNSQGISTYYLDTYIPAEDDLISYPYNNPLGNINNVSFIPCLFSKCFSFNSSNYINITSPRIILNNYSDFTITFWFKSYNNTLIHTLFSQTYNGNRTNIQITNNLVLAGLYDGTNGYGSKSGSATQTINENEWYFLTYSYNSSNSKGNLTINTIEQTGTTGPTSTSTIGSHIGQTASNSNRFNGSIDEFIIFNKVLTSAEIKSLYESNRELLSKNNYFKGQDINPITNIIYNLGSSTLRWLKLWVKDIDASGNVNISGNISVKRAYAMFSSNDTYTMASASTSYPINFSITEDNYLIGIESNRENITFMQSGDYLIEVSAIFSVDTVNKKVELWVQKANGTGSGKFANIPRSNTIMTLPSSSTAIPLAVPFILDFMPGDKLRFMTATDDAGSQLLYTTNTSYSPETPSIIVTISKISEITD